MNITFFIVGNFHQEKIFTNFTSFFFNEFFCPALRLYHRMIFLSPHHVNFIIYFSCNAKVKFLSSEIILAIH